jgi:hypothetical protein
MAPCARGKDAQGGAMSSAGRCNLAAGCGRPVHFDAVWHRNPGYDYRRAPYEHPDFTSNALNADLFRDSLNL